ncbi:DUF3617 domain-containing protein [Sphingomonas xanthus]|uniref:DUF3617 family protein n=1 Tax=Sphingomonas xanthus TaxID=2594473 RepID=A0A516IQV1_9SPHN|nr:DUF3617 family protein [Sphingomonas xanthus]QDP19296.1 DUF3617 family protein [Sphingomonas xanthus]
MKRVEMMAVAAAALVLSGCGGEAEAPKAEAAATALNDGLFELTSEVTALSSTDNTTPATALKVGDTQTIQACVADNKPSPDLFAEGEDKCEMKNSYIRNGRFSAQLTCQRDGKRGEVMPAMMGKFTADSFEGDITAMTYFIEDGDYRITRKVSAKRVGDCPAPSAETAAVG